MKHNFLSIQLQEKDPIFLKKGSYLVTERFRKLVTPIKLLQKKLVFDLYQYKKWRLLLNVWRENDENVSGTKKLNSEYFLFQPKFQDSKSIIVLIIHDPIAFWYKVLWNLELTVSKASWKSKDTVCFTALKSPLLLEPILTTLSCWTSLLTRYQTVVDSSGQKAKIH